MEMATDFPSTFSEESCIKMVGYDLTANAANRLYAKTGLKAADMDVIELHDCFSANELITYEALGLCPEGITKDSQSINCLFINLVPSCEETSFSDHLL